MKPYEPVTDRLSTLNQLDQIRMSPGARRTAKACLRQAELLADMRSFGTPSASPRAALQLSRAAAGGPSQGRNRTEWRST